MKPRSVLGAVWMQAVLLVAPLQAQNLGLGTGSRAPAPADSTAPKASQDPSEEAPLPRKNQFNKRLGLTARRNAVFDPKAFEARGRELQGQFYEIGAPAAPAARRSAEKSASQQGPAERTLVERKNGSRQWMIWVGLAGLAGAGAGAAGYFLMANSHPASTPPDIPLRLDDSP